MTEPLYIYHIFFIHPSIDGHLETKGEMNKWDYIKLKKILNSEGNHQHANATDWVGEDSWASGIWCVCVLVTQSCLTFCNPIAYQTTVLYEILQARILEWVAIPFSRGSSWLRDWIQVSRIAGRLFTIWATWEAPYMFDKGLLSNTKNLSNSTIKAKVEK